MSAGAPPKVMLETAKPSHGAWCGQPAATATASAPEVSAWRNNGRRQTTRLAWPRTLRHQLEGERTPA